MSWIVALPFQFIGCMILLFALIAFWKPILLGIVVCLAVAALSGRAS